MHASACSAKAYGCLRLCLSPAERGVVGRGFFESASDPCHERAEQPRRARVADMVKSDDGSFNSYIYPRTIL